MSNPVTPGLLADLIAANRLFLQVAISQSTDDRLSPDTDVDEYITMLAAYPRSVRRSMTGADAAIVEMCRALKAAQDSTAQESVTGAGQ